MKVTKPKYLVAIYREDMIKRVSTYSIAVSSIEEGIIIESFTKILKEDEFKKDIDSIINYKYPECGIIFNNECRKLVVHLEEEYKDKLLKPNKEYANNKSQGKYR